MVAGKRVLADDLVRVALTCKYMGWDYVTYMNQPCFFVEIIDIIRTEESKEMDRESKRTNSKYGDKH